MSLEHIVLLVVALSFFKINNRFVLVSLLSFSPGTVFPRAQQAKKQCILSSSQMILKISVLIELN